MKKLNAYDYYLLAYLLYWALIMYRLFTREYLEMGDTFSFLIYSFFIMIHSVVLVFRYLFRNHEKRLRVVMRVSALPSIATGIVMMLSLFLWVFSLAN